MVPVDGDPCKFNCLAAVLNRIRCCLPISSPLSFRSLIAWLPRVLVRFSLLLPYVVFLSASLLSPAFFPLVSRPPSIMSHEDAAHPLLHPDAVIRYDETWRVSVCKKCKMGVHGDTLKKHLTEKHHRYRKPDWGPIIDALKGRPQPKSNDGFPCPPNGIAPIPDLVSIVLLERMGVEEGLAPPSETPSLR